MGGHHDNPKALGAGILPAVLAPASVCVYVQPCACDHLRRRTRLWGSLTKSKVIGSWAAAALRVSSCAPSGALPRWNAQSHDRGLRTPLFPQTLPPPTHPQRGLPVSVTQPLGPRPPRLMRPNPLPDRQRDPSEDCAELGSDPTPHTSYRNTECQLH